MIGTVSERTTHQSILTELLLRADWVCLRDLRESVQGTKQEACDITLAIVRELEHAKLIQTRGGWTGGQFQVKATNPRALAH